MATSTSFEWAACFLTNIAEVDEQHHHLVDLINRFGERLTSGEDGSPADTEEVFSDLASYAQHHFREEEMLMARARVDDRHAHPHKVSHSMFLGEVVRMREAMVAGKTTAQQLHQFLMHWLAYHILGTDQSMAHQLSAIEAGSAPSAAYKDEAEARQTKCATEPLLHALNGLFEQVTHRNRELVDLNRTLESKVEERTRALSDLNRQLALANQKLEDAANTDALTRLPNRRHAMMCFEREWQSTSGTGAPLACILIDADHFKEVNDTAGHDAGDEVLRRLAATLRDCIRTDDVAARLGGDEFLILCPGTPLAGAMALAEHIRRQVANLRVPAGAGCWNGSISVGVAVRRPGMTCVQDLIRTADEGTYLAKRAGRNAVRTTLTIRTSIVPPSSRCEPARQA